jgi:hypothetical protein
MFDDIMTDPIMKDSSLAMDAGSSSDFRKFKKEAAVKGPTYDFGI